MAKNRKQIIYIKSKHGTFKCMFTWYKEDGGYYFVDVPGLPATHTFGKNLTEAKYMAKDIIDLMCEELIESNNIIIDDKNMAIGRIPRSRVISVG